MKKYKISDLRVIKVDDIYLICINNYMNDDYTEILTNKKIKYQVKMEIEPLSNYYSILALKKYKTNKELMLSKEAILYKYLEINNQLYLDKNENSKKKSHL